jgi:hypothetical protein
MTTAGVTKANEGMSGNRAQERALQRLPYESFA